MIELEVESRLANLSVIEFGSFQSTSTLPEACRKDPAQSQRTLRGFHKLFQ